MKIYYANSNLEIIRTIFDKDDFTTEVVIGYPYSMLEVDEIDPVNKANCNDVARIQKRKDINGLQKYHMIDNAGVIELHKRDGWEEYHPE